MTGSATPLVQWEEGFLDALGGAGYRVVLFDYRDAGRVTYVDVSVPDSMPEMMSALASGQLQPPYGIADIARDVLGLLDAVSVERAHLFGLSLGGGVGQILAARAPERVLSLTSVSFTTSDPTLPLPAPEMMKDLSRPLPSTRGSTSPGTPTYSPPRPADRVHPQGVGWRLARRASGTIAASTVRLICVTCSP